MDLSNSDATSNPMLRSLEMFCDFAAKQHYYTLFIKKTTVPECVRIAIFSGCGPSCFSVLGLDFIDGESTYDTRTHLYGLRRSDYAVSTTR